MCFAREMCTRSTISDLQAQEQDLTQFMHLPNKSTWQTVGAAKSSFGTAKTARLCCNKYRNQYSWLSCATIGGFYENVGWFWFGNDGFWMKQMEIPPLQHSPWSFFLAEATASCQNKLQIARGFFCLFKPKSNFTPWVI